METARRERGGAPVVARQEPVAQDGEAPEALLLGHVDEERRRDEVHGLRTRHEEASARARPHEWTKADAERKLERTWQ